MRTEEDCAAALRERYTAAIVVMPIDGIGASHDDSIGAAGAFATIVDRRNQVVIAAVRIDVRTLDSGAGGMIGQLRAGCASGNAGGFIDGYNLNSARPRA